jgi:hypothetical protein
VKRCDKTRVKRRRMGEQEGLIQGIGRCGVVDGVMDESVWCRTSLYGAG